VEKGFCASGHVGGDPQRGSMSQSVVPFRPPLLAASEEIGLLLDEVADLHQSPRGRWAET
jgi:hypothetical protein